MFGCDSFISSPTGHLFSSRQNSRSGKFSNRVNWVKWRWVKWQWVNCPDTNSDVLQYIVWPLELQVRLVQLIDLFFFLDK